MDFHKLVSRLAEIDRQAEANTAECGAMPTNVAPPNVMQEIPPPSMSVNLNAQGLDNIESMMKLFQKVNPDMMPAADAPMSVVSPLKTFSGPSMKMLPDYGINDTDADLPAGDIDSPSTDSDVDMIMRNGQGEQDMDLPADHDADHELVKSLDRDGDGDHDMDDHALDFNDEEDIERKTKESATFDTATTRPDEKVCSIDYMTNQLAGGMNRPKGTHPKVAGGDNPMQRVRESEGERIKADLRRRLAEMKGSK